MIPSEGVLDKEIISRLQEIDPVVAEYRAFFRLVRLEPGAERTDHKAWPGWPPHPEKAYIKALLIKKCENCAYITQLRRFLVKHPLLVLELGFIPVDDPLAAYGFDVEQTVPC
ncbi:MAG TPA: hypothetical protein VEC93_09620, partial [Anaerolineae bacterium]|nr:hypothetical protein [Anaerolineae bacterium]